MSTAELKIMERNVHSLTKKTPPLPDFSRFTVHFKKPNVPGGRIREAYFMAYDEN